MTSQPLFLGPAAGVSLRGLTTNLPKLLPRLPSITSIGSVIAKGGRGAAAARSARNSSTGATPQASNIGKISKGQLAKSLGTSTAVTAGSIAGITAIQGAIKPIPTGPGFTTPIQEITKTVTGVSDNLAGPLNDISKFARENSTLLLILGLGITAVVLIK